MYQLITITHVETYSTFTTEAAAKKAGNAAIKAGAKKVVVHCNSDWEMIKGQDYNWETYYN